MSKIIVANWKMNGSLEMAHAYCTTLKALAKKTPPTNTLVICPPSPYLSFVNGALSGTCISLGAQDCSAHEKGAFTGSTSAQMLQDVGCPYVIIAHSERRQQFNESLEDLTSKVTQALTNKLIPIFCIGESLADFEAGKTNDTLIYQLTSLKGINAPLIIAYEPVWAIGTGKVASPEVIEKTCLFIQSHLKDTYALTCPILYGGSVTPENAGDILALPSVDGLLVGGASLKADGFWAIAQAA
jgi:triosephosphate isomerase